IQTIHYYYYYFFFQAEDGIRDRNVTGVQTCALPILYTFTPHFSFRNTRRNLLIPRIPAIQRTPTTTTPLRQSDMTHPEEGIVQGGGYVKNPTGQKSCDTDCVH